MGPINHQYLLVLTDDYSRYPVVEIINSTRAEIVIPILDKILSQFGVPETIRSDNGAPFSSEQFQQYAKYMGFNHRRITPYHPRANGEVERFMRTLNKAIRAAIVEGKNWKQELYKFLRNYRSTPHCSTKTSPYEGLFGRKIQSRLPMTTNAMKTALTSQIRENDIVAKQMMKKNYEMRMKPKNKQLQVGSKVLLRNKQHSKTEAPYNPEPYSVIGMKGSMVTASNGRRSVVRN